MKLSCTADIIMFFTGCLQAEPPVWEWKRDFCADYILKMMIFTDFEFKVIANLELHSIKSQ